MKLSGGSPSFAAELNIDAFLEQVIALYLHHPLANTAGEDFGDVAYLYLQSFLSQLLSSLLFLQPI